MRVLSAASEVFPLVKTGGLADVTGALPAALKRNGIATATFLPGYPSVMSALSKTDTLHAFEHLFGGKARVLKARTKTIDLLVLDAPHLFDRPGNIYLGPDGKDWPDNAMRFAAFSRVAADIAMGRLGEPRFDILHAHDWQAALALTYLRYDPAPAQDKPQTVLTIHNMAFQGSFDATLFPALGLPATAFAIDGLEYFGKVSFLKGGITSASRLTTVSPTYAQEITTPEFGMGLDGVLRERRGTLTGIVNGIDGRVWNPRTDQALAENYTRRTLSSRAVNKRALEQRLGLDPGDGILHGVVSRLTWQKGLDLLGQHVDWLVRSGARLAIVGTGEPAIEDTFRNAARRHKGRIAAVFAYDETLSHLIQGGADTILVPSRFEPCGLTQLYGLRYGCVPVVSRTGGLADTIIDANVAAVSAGTATGIQFSPVNGDTLQSALLRAHALFADSQTWRTMQKRGMSQDVSWAASAKAYADLYRSMVAQ